MTTVVVVDDHPVFRSGIAALLEVNGYEVVGEAAGAAEAVELVRRLRPAIVLMDLGLPDGSGVAATERIVAEHPEVRVVVVTMFDDDGSVRAALSAGAAGYVVKDAGHAEIVAAVRAAELGAWCWGPASPPGDVRDHIRGAGRGPVRADSPRAPGARPRRPWAHERPDRRTAGSLRQDGQQHRFGHPRQDGGPRPGRSRSTCPRGASDGRASRSVILEVKVPAAPKGSCFVENY